MLYARYTMPLSGFSQIWAQRCAVRKSTIGQLILWFSSKKQHILAENVQKSPPSKENEKSPLQFDSNILQGIPNTYGEGMENRHHNLNSLSHLPPTLGQSHNSSLAPPPSYYRLNMTLVTALLHWRIFRKEKIVNWKEA